MTSSMKIPYNPRRSENQDRFPSGDRLPCLICGKAVQEEDPAMVWVHGGGAEIVTPREGRARNARPNGDAEDLGWQPVGKGCLKQYPELRRYATRDFTREDLMRAYADLYCQVYGGEGQDVHEEEIRGDATERLYLLKLQDRRPL